MGVGYCFFLFVSGFYQSLFICNPNNRAIIFHSDKFFYLCNQEVEEEIGSAEEQPISNKLLDDMQ